MSNAGIGYGTITITDLSDKPFQWNYIVGTQNPDISTPEKVPHLQGQISNTYTSVGTKSVATRGFRITNTAAKRVLIRFGAGTNASASITEDNLMGLTAGQTYTLSFDARWRVLSGTSETTTRYMEASFYDNSANSTSFSRTAYQRFGTVTATDRKKDMTGRCEFTFTIPQTATKCYILIANNRTTDNNYASGDYIEILNVMLEDGEYFTSWSPNPLDLNGTNGEDGDDGKGISEIIEYYQISNSNSTAPSTWLTSPIATTVENPYLWNYEEIVYTIGNPYISSPRVIGTRGANGSDGHGYSCAQIILYKRSATTPSNKPSDLTYTFSTGLLSGENSSSFNGWSQQIPSGSEPLWMIAATATGTGSTDIISFNEWTSTPVKILENGADGYNQVTLILYQRNSQQPSTPIDTINYNFSTGEWTPPSGWFKQIPTSDGNPCWITTTTIISKNTTASNSGWSNVIKMVQDGAKGQPGDSFAWNLITGTKDPDASDANKRPHMIEQNQTTVISTNSTVTTAVHGIRITANADSIRPYIRFGNSTSSSASLNGLEPGHTYTLSFDAKYRVLSSDTGKANTSKYYMRSYFYRDKTTTGSFASTYYTWDEVSQSDKGVDKTARCQYTFTVESNVTILYLYIACSNLSTSHYKTGDYIELSNLKLEEGSKATPWAPAYEELNGANGIKTAQVVLYKQGTTANSVGKPTGNVTYNFNSSTVDNTNLNGWTQAIPTPSSNNHIWMIAATATSIEDTDIISTDEWTTTPIQVTAIDGEAGLNQAILRLYKRDTQLPQQPTATVTYNFSDGSWTAPSGWSKEIPTSDGNPCYMTTAVVISRESSASTNGWSDVIKIVEDGAQGYSVVAYITRDSFTESQWATYGTVGHAETWSSTSSIRNGCRIGDLFAVVGVSTDGGKAHTAFYRSTTASGNLQGECIAHTYSNAGADAQWYYGTALTHTSGTASLATSNTAGVIIGAMYLNTSTSLVYKCTVISGSTATWIYAGNLTDGVIDNIEIGGTNLLLNSSFTNDYDKWTKNGSPVITTVDGLSCGHITGLSSGTVYAQQNIFDAIKNDEEGQIYTVSADIKVVDYVSTSSSTMLDLYFGGSYNNNGTSTWLGATRINGLPQGGHLMDYNNLGWQRVYYTFRFAHKPTKMTFSVYVKNCTGDLYFRNLKLEKGNMPSDWSPAPEDVSNEINTAINNLQTNLQSQLDEKIQTWVQNINPATEWTTSTLQEQHNGDLWYYIGTSNLTIGNVTIEPSCVYEYDGSNNTWSRYDSTVTSLFDFIDGKSTIFYGTTSGTYNNVKEGDYLVDNTNGSTYYWNGSNWVKVTDYQTSIENAIDDIEIGGRNYYIIKDSSLGYLVTSISSLHAATFRKERTSDFIAVTPGEKLTMQVWVTPTSGEQPWIAYMFCQSDKETTVGSRVAKYGATNDTYLAYINIEVPANAAYVRVSARMQSDGRMKIEKSSMSTDWTPAPEDVSNDILEAVDNISIGGRNLLRTVAQEHNSSGYRAYQIPTIDALENDSYILQLWDVTLDAESTGIKPFWGGGNIPMSTSLLMPDENGYICVKWTPTAEDLAHANAQNKYINLYNNPSGHTGCKAKIEKWKLEKGNMPTVWSPASEDGPGDGINLIVNTLAPDVSEAAKYPRLKGQTVDTGGRGTATVAEHGIRFTNTTANWQFIRFGNSVVTTLDLLGLEPGEIYTYSGEVDFKIFSGSPASDTEYVLGVFVYGHYGSDTSNNLLHCIPIHRYMVSDLTDRGTEFTGVKFTATFALPSNINKLYIDIRGGTEAGSTAASHHAVGDYIEVRNMKIERGSTATDWTPAPEDVDTSITGIQNKITAIYGTCSTTAGTAAKEIICSNFTLYDGATITIKSSTANTAAAPTLNVNNTGAKPVWFNNAVTSSSNAFYWGANAEIQFVYHDDGTNQYWSPIGYPRSYYGTSSTGASTRAKASTITGAVICKGTVVNILITNPNSYTSNTVQLNISSTGAKNIYVNGAAWRGQPQYNWPASTTVSFTFDGTYWRMQGVASLLSSNGKNNNYYSSSSAQPSGNFTIGDTWFVLDANNCVSAVKQWDGTDWILTEYTSGIFSSIDAGKITTGQMSANHIRAGVLQSEDENTYFDLTNGIIVTSEPYTLPEWDASYQTLGVADQHTIISAGGFSHELPYTDIVSGEINYYDAISMIDGALHFKQHFYDETQQTYNLYTADISMVQSAINSIHIGCLDFRANEFVFGGFVNLEKSAEIYNRQGLSPYLDFRRTDSAQDDFDVRIINNKHQTQTYSQLQIEHKVGSKFQFRDGGLEIWARAGQPTAFIDFHHGSDVGDNASDHNGRIYINDTSKTIKVDSTIANASDAALKDNIQLIDPSYIELIDKFKPYQFTYKNANDKKHFGLIAQDVEQSLNQVGITNNKPIISEPVNEDDYYGLNYTQIIPLLIMYCKDLRSEINELKKKLNNN